MTAWTRMAAMMVVIAGPSAALAQADVPPPAGTLPSERMATTPAEADVVPGSFSGAVTLTSDYVFRGISQSDENPAIQGSLDWKHETGLFVGVWGSSVDFDDGDQASAELDWYAGWAGDFRMVGLDVRAIYYNYPGADTPRDYDYWELGAAATVSPLANIDLTVGYNFSPDFFNESGTAHYVHGGAAYTLAGLMVPVTVSADVGRQWINDNSFFGTPDYWHWTLGLGVTVEGFDLAVAYSDTDLSTAECGGGLGTCGQRVVVSGGYAF